VTVITDLRAEINMNSDRNSDRKTYQRAESNLNGDRDRADRRVDTHNISRTLQHERSPRHMQERAAIALTSITTAKHSPTRTPNHPHKLQRTTSRDLCGLVCPSRITERGGKGDCVKERGGEEGEREREHALGVFRF